MSESKPIRILYIEDDSDTAHRFRQKLEQAGYVVDIATSGEAGLEMFQTTEYDVIAVDQDMPVQPGLETIRLLSRPGPMPPTLIVTGPGGERAAVEAMEYGASDYIIKDVAGGYLELLVAVVEQVLEQQRLAEAKRRAEEEARRNAERIERAKQEWEATVDSLEQLVCLLDDQGRIIRVNRTVERWNLASVAEVQGMDLHNMLHPKCDDPACPMKRNCLQAWEAVAQGRVAALEIEDQLYGRVYDMEASPITAETSWQDKASTNFAVVIFKEISERKRIEEEREKLIKELDAFARTVAHDLQTPLARVIGFAEFLEAEYRTLPPEKSSEYLESIAKNSRKMGNIIHELLLLAGVRQRTVQVSPLDIGLIVDEAQQRLVDIIEQYQAEIALPEAWPVALGYGPWIEEVWVNYLSNAIVYGGRPPYIKLGAVEQADGMVCFWIHDNGAGLTKEEQQEVFTPFVQMGQVQTQGHGLGLSIVQRIVEKLGGQVGVESTGSAGEGCVFSFTLPAPRNG